MKKTYFSIYECVEMDGGRTRIGDADSQQLIENITDNFDGMITTLVADGVSRKDATASQRCCPSYFGMVLLQVRQSTVPHELVEDMACVQR